MNNGRRYSVDIKRKARKLRREGKTHREIKIALGISLASAHLWTKGIVLSKKQKQSIHKRWYAIYLSYLEDHREDFRKMAKTRLVPYQYKQQYTKKDLLNEIKSFHKKHGRIPLKREMVRRIFRQHFGTWNNAIVAAGLEPNPVLFAKKFVAEDGHKCDSFSEKIIDDWLFKKGVAHDRHVPYGGTKMTADFAIQKVRIEFFGLAGEQKEYDRLVAKKKEYCKRNKLRLVEIYPDNLYSDKNFLEGVTKKLPDAAFP